MIVNGFWFGKMGEVQQRCIDSWEKNGYEFKLWNESNCDEILSTDEYFTYQHGHSKGTPIAFSNIATCIIYSEHSGEQIFKDWASRIRKIGENSTHGDLGPNSITPLVVKYGYQDYALPKENFCPVVWQSYEDVFTYDGDAYGLHLYTSLWSEEDEISFRNLY